MEESDLNIEIEKKTINTWNLVIKRILENDIGDDVEYVSKEIYINIVYKFISELDLCCKAQGIYWTDYSTKIEGIGKIMLEMVHGKLDDINKEWEIIRKVNDRNGLVYSFFEESEPDY